MNLNGARHISAASATGPRGVLSIMLTAVVSGSLVLAGPAPGAVASVNQEPPQLVSFWGLDGHGNDLRGDNHLTLAGVAGVDYLWVEDQFGLPEFALALTGSGQGYAHTASPGMSTDASFTVDGWFGLVSLPDRPQTVLSQTGRIRPAMQLQATPAGSWRFAVPTGDPNSGLGVVESEPGSVIVGMWNHLAGVLDLSAGRILLYVNGRLAAASDVGPAPQPAEGPLYFGVTGTADGATSQPLHGVLDFVGVWSGALDAERIRDRAFAGDGPPQLTPIPSF